MGFLQPDWDATELRTSGLRPKSANDRSSLENKGTPIFLGDVLDLERKAWLVDSHRVKRRNGRRNIFTKTEFVG